MKPYVPQPGTIPARVIDWLWSNPGEHAPAVIADALDIAVDGLSTTLQTAVDRGAIHRAKRDGRVMFSIGAIQPGDAGSDEDDDDDGQMVQRVVPARQRTRWGIWSDGTIVIERGKTRLELDATDAASLAKFLERAPSV